MITLYTVNFHGQFAHGLVRDIRARWALEEAGLPYETRLLSRQELADPAHRAIHPFGKVPAISDGALAVFESAAIVLHLGNHSQALLPAEPVARARVTSWICAAVSTLESPVEALSRIDHFPIDEQADRTIRPRTAEVVRQRLRSLSEALGGRDYLEGKFSGADVLMRSVLDMLRHTDLVDEFRNLADYMGRCAARPAFRRAMRDHLAAYNA